VRATTISAGAMAFDTDVAGDGAPLLGGAENGSWWRQEAPELVNAAMGEWLDARG